jgi:beta-glucosidase
MKRMRCISCFVALALLAGCGKGLPAATPLPSAAPSATETAVVAQTAAGPFPFQDAGLPVEERVKDLLGRMTLEEKAGQMVAADIAGASPASVGKNMPGAVLNGGDSAFADSSPREWRAMISRYQDAALACRLPVPLLYGLDAVHGLSGVAGAVIFPQNIGLGAADDPELMMNMGEVVAGEMRAAGVLWDFAPCVAAAQDPRWGRTYESYSSDPAVVSRLSLSF